MNLYYSIAAIIAAHNLPLSAKDARFGGCGPAGSGRDRRARETTTHSEKLAAE
jgi:hypothetical protein